MALTDLLKASWDLADVTDSQGSNDLTNNNGVSFVDAGSDGDVAEFVSANSEFLSHADNDDLSLTNKDATFALWVKFDDVSGTRSLIAKWGTNEYILYLSGGSLRWRAGESGVEADFGTTLVVDTWYFVVVDVDTTEETLSIDIDNSGSPVVADTVITNATSDTFHIGARNTGAWPIDGQVASVRLWHRVLTPSERTELFNGGPSMTHADLAGGAANTLTAEQGSYAVSGQDTSLLAGRLLTADQGSFTLAGQEAALTRGFGLTADQGSFALTGQDTGLFANRLLEAQQGSFSLSGQVANLLASRLLSGEFGTFTLSGQAATLTHNEVGAFTLTADSGSFTLSGQEAQLLAAHIITADQGTFTLSGQAAAVLAGRLLTAEQGSLTITGQEAALIVSHLLTAEQGAFALTGQDAILTALTDDVLVTLEVSLQDVMTITAELSDVFTLTASLED